MAAATFVDFLTGVFRRKSAVETGPATSPAEQLVSTNAAGLVDVTLLPIAGGGSASAVIESAAQGFARRLTGT